MTTASGTVDADDLGRLRPRGSNQIGMSQFNERVVLQAIRFHGSMPKADIARLTNLSSQTISLIINRLLDEGLVLKQPSRKGRIGQPSVPIALNPEGAYAIGVNIGRRSMDVLLIDFVGNVQSRSSLPYAYPDPARLFPEIANQLARLHDVIGAERARRLCGIGVAAPLMLGGWHQLLTLEPAQTDQWNQIDIAARIQAMTALPVQFAKDTAAACVAELVAGRGRGIKSFLYVFVGTFIGGGVVLDSHLRSGRHGNAGALGSMPLGLARADAAAPPEQLLSAASLFNLEQLFDAAGLDTTASTDARALEAPWYTHTMAWLDDAACAIALTINSATGLLDLDDIIIDGSLDRRLLALLLVRVEAALDDYSWEGISRPAVLAGTIGADARAIGGALLPLYAHFAPDRDLFLKLDK